MARTIPGHSIWRARWNEAIHHMFWVVCISAIYLTTELSIWGLSFVLASAQLQYFGSIVGMIAVLSIMTAVGQVCASCDRMYHRWIKSKVDFINAQLGVGFSVPIIMLNHVLGIRDIGYIVAASAITNVVSWVGVFLLSLLTILLITHLQSYASKHARNQGSKASALASHYDVTDTIRRAAAQNYERPWQSLTSDDSVEKTKDRTSSSKDAQAAEGRNIIEAKAEDQDKSLWYILRRNGYVAFCLVAVTGIGIPLELLLHDSRVLDGFTLWLCWLIAIRLQRTVKSSRLFGANVRYRHSLATMINPVLVTTMFMLGITRLRGCLQGSDGIARVLERFSSGIPLYTVWTAVVTHSVISDNPTGWIGAGDFALSLLECGIVTWGFKLYECRKQLFSVCGISTLLFSAIAAGGNVFLSVLLARVLGLHPEEALAFAARSVTLALAKPSIKALGGNIALNATLVVSNGILGQLMYPILLDKLSVPTVQPDSECNGKKKPEQADEDGAVTVAAGTAIGINGAAMGVSYLYEVKSRAAPYAALSMTMFGLMTVVFTTLEPFRTMTLKLASW